jgi:hypothetical protein
MKYFGNTKFNLSSFPGKKVTTTNFTTSKTKKNIEKFANHHYIEMWPLVDHYYDKKKTFDVLILPLALKKITTSQIKNIFLSNYLWHITYGYQGLWGPGVFG